MAVILGSNVSELRTVLCFLLVFTVVVTAILSMDAMLDLTNSKGFASKVRHVVESKELETREIIVQEEPCGSSKECHQNRTEIEHLIQQEQLTMLEADIQIPESHSRNLTSTGNNLQMVTHEKLSDQPRSEEEPVAWWDRMMHIQKERKSHLRRICQEKYNENTLPISDFVAQEKNIYSFYFVDKFKLLYNFVHKVGSSHWAQMLKRLNQGKLKRLYTLPRQEALWRLENYTSFIIVRHPLVRLLSAYKDKFIDHHIAHFKSIGRNILKSFRPNVTQSELENPIDVKFEEFLRYLVANKRNRGNTHWDEIVIRNKVCLYDMDIIAKLDTGEDDNQLILRTFKIEKIAQLGSEYKNYTGKLETIRSFYSQIPQIY
ncbi:putative carbohydrate sulfotransferase 14-like isoform X2 [Apostichopus japonicus]|uniref:Carbohydrate sulfotransferase n=1 Tax=Stichopus japonicus TaxID=307972 RepID=A0A2G8JLT0_STIJA|nr:putative carbohydrate sulfotransferase 14-like isoform X2 [Apostichopus japonicus]